MNVAKHSDVVFTVFHPKGLNDDTEFSGFYNAVFKGGGIDGTFRQFDVHCNATSDSSSLSKGSIR